MSRSNASPSLRLRAATAEDARRIYAWRNDPWIVALGSSGKPVAWAEHTNWLQEMLSDDSHLLLVIEVAGVGAGTVRLDLLSSARAIVTIYLLREFTGQGLGVRALEQACAQGFSQWPITAIHAYIRSDNGPSLTAFAKAGFAPTNTADCPPGHSEMMLRRL